MKTNSVSKFNLREVFSYKVNGANLLTKTTKKWLNITRSNVFIMAFLESISWGYLGWLFADDETIRWFTGISLGLIVFTIVWALDTMLVLLDRGKTFYDEKIYQMEEKEEVVKNGQFGKMLEYLSKVTDNKVLSAAVLTRTLLAGGSLFFTAPYLTQLVFNKDINLAIEKQSSAIISNKRTSIEFKADAKINHVRKELDSASNEEIKEIGGAGITRRKGKGETAKAIEEKKKTKANELNHLLKEKENSLKDFDSLVKDKKYSDLAKKWGINIPQNSMVERSKVINPILETSEAARAEMTIQALLLFIFISLLLLKIYEPRGVRIYLSEALQQSYTTYMNGGYNKYLETHERYNGTAPLQPYEFEEFMIYVYPKKRQSEKDSIISKEDKARLEIIKSSIADLEVVRKNEESIIKAPLEALNTELKAKQSELSTLNKSKGSLENKIKDLSKIIIESGGAISEIGKMDRQNNGSRISSDTLEITKVLIKQKTTHSASTTDKDLTEKQLKQCNQEIAIIDGQIEGIIAKIEKISSLVNHINQKIDGLKRREIDLYVSLTNKNPTK
ncbi:hypothetical protein [Spirosoma foliorum]|uniref:DUF4407 domain-containing protein n=1 Tax=Spirosoma foliorum TaxID=2710596 RepID=A0A7G5H2S0_9BACT|nr:hypothetical protein [Spirosoma foliorum]QMW05412.1 hypothetical protein H3H32_11220 [Spirosoma foliorum]